MGRRVCVYDSCLFIRGFVYSNHVCFNAVLDQLNANVRAEVCVRGGRFNRSGRISTADLGTFRLHQVTPLLIHSSLRLEERT